MIALIAAIADNNVIGKAGELPWYIPEDLKHFRELTTGGIVIMGRKTHESVLKRLGRPLPNRTSVVVTSQDDYSVPEGVMKATSVFDALEKWGTGAVFVIGGSQVYKEALPLVDKLYVTHVHQATEGDVFFPEIDWSKWEVVSKDEKEGFTFTDYTRV